MNAITRTALMALSNPFRSRHRDTPGEFKQSAGTFAPQVLQWLPAPAWNQLIVLRSAPRCRKDQSDESAQRRHVDLEFDTRQHSAGYFKMVRGMDMITGYTPERAWRYIEDMTDDDAPQSVRDDIGNADIPAVARASCCLSRGGIRDRCWSWLHGASLPRRSLRSRASTCALAPSSR
jgi:hypothetical protein